MTRVSLCSAIGKDGYVLLPFYKDKKPLANGARWGMTVRAAGTMRFRWNETNENRVRMLASICGKRTPVSLELIHSKIVYDISTAHDTDGAQGDGMITQNAALVPVVTVADCVPLFLYDEKTGVFGVCHSGWKGTGIIAQAIALAEKHYGARREDISVAIGAHIHDCCYTVDEERAAYFAENFTSDCVQKIADGGDDALSIGKNTSAGGKAQYRLSLEKANLAVLACAGIRTENIVVAEDCTCCTKDARGDYPLGSFRRQAAFAPGNVSPEERSRLMTVQAAFCGLFQ